MCKWASLIVLSWHRVFTHQGHPTTRPVHIRHLTRRSMVEQSTLKYLTTCICLCPCISNTIAQILGTCISHCLMDRKKNLLYNNWNSQRVLNTVVRRNIFRSPCHHSAHAFCAFLLFKSDVKWHIFLTLDVLYSYACSDSK